MIVATPAAATTPAPTGGAVAGPTPKIKALQCRTACMGVTAGHIGSRGRVEGMKGKSLKRIDSVVFEGAPGAGGDGSLPPPRGEEKDVDAAGPPPPGHRPVVP